MTLKDLIERLQAIQKEVGEGPPHEGIKGGVRVCLDYMGPANPNLLETDLVGEIVDVTPDTAWGCGCWLDACIHIVVKPESSVSASTPPPIGETK